MKTTKMTISSPRLLILLMLVMMMMTNARAQAPTPPTITKPAYYEEIYTRENLNQHQKCEATGYPVPDIEWFYSKTKDDFGAIITQTNPEGGLASFDGKTGDLWIGNLSASAIGYYSCRAINTFTGGLKVTALSPRLYIGIARVGQWNPSAATSTVTVTVGQYAELPCQDVPAFFGPTGYRWVNVSTSNSDQLPPIQMGNRKFIDDKGNLHFTYMEQSDLQLNYNYACGLTNQIAGQSPSGGTIRLEMTLGSLAPTNPVLRYKTSKNADGSTFELGYPAKIKCFFSGYPTPVVTWKDNGGNEITEGNGYTFENDKRTLVINIAGTEHDTTYTCVGTNPQDSSKSVTEDVWVNITSPPIWVKPLQSQTVVQGKNATFYCDSRSMVDENSPEKPKWFKNGSPMSNTHDPKKFSFSNEGKTMTVISLNKRTDISCFQCLVKNSVGESFGDGCLNVILPIEILTQPDPKQVISKGDVVNLTVVAITDPDYTLSYRWIFKNKTYDSVDAPPYVNYDFISGLAYINTSGMSDEQLRNITGVYQRIVFHRFESRTVPVEVELYVPPGPAVAGFPFWIIGLIIAILLILLIIIICCCVYCRRKMQEGDYPVDRKETAAGLDPEKEVKESSFPALSRADDPDQLKKKGSHLDIDDEYSNPDDSFGSADYGEDEPSAFNEDGSFIGVYKNKPKSAVHNPGFQPNPQLHRDYPTYRPESNV